MHPLFVHFPIALLVIYGLMELTPARFTKRLKWWQGTKVFLLAIGVLSAFPTMITGDVDAHQPIRQAQHNLIEVHEGFAGATVNIFGLLLGAYVVRLLDGTRLLRQLLSYLGPIARLWGLLHKLARIILKNWVKIGLVLIGLTTLTITGGLGASIVYGPDADPVVHFIYNLIVGQ